MMYYEEKMYSDNEGREVIEFIQRTTPAEGEKVLPYSFAAVISMPVPLGQIKLTEQVNIPIMAIEKGRLPLINAKSVMEAFEQHDTVIEAVQKAQAEQAKKPKLLVPESAKPSLKLVQ